MLRACIANGNGHARRAHALYVLKDQRHFRSPMMEHAEMARCGTDRGLMRMGVSTAWSALPAAGDHRGVGGWPGARTFISVRKGQREPHLPPTRGIAVEQAPSQRSPPPRTPSMFTSHRHSTSGNLGED